MIYAVLAPVCLGAFFALCIAWRLEPRWLEDALFIAEVMRDYREETEGAIRWTWCQNCQAIIAAGSLYCEGCAKRNLDDSTRKMAWEIAFNHYDEWTDAERSHEALPQREPLLAMG